jgi:hypothetical protein
MAGMGEFANCAVDVISKLAAARAEKKRRRLAGNTFRAAVAAR